MLDLNPQLKLPVPRERASRGTYDIGNGRVRKPIADSFYGPQFLQDIEQLRRKISEWKGSRFQILWKYDPTLKIVTPSTPWRHDSHSWIVYVLDANHDYVGRLPLHRLKNLKKQLKAKDIGADFDVLEEPFRIKFLNGGRSSSSRMLVIRLKERHRQALPLRDTTISGADPRPKTAPLVDDVALSYLRARYGADSGIRNERRNDFSAEAEAQAFWSVRPGMNESFTRFTPLVTSPLLTQLVGLEVLVKDQSEQYQGSFKALGAHNFLNWHIQNGVDPTRTAVIAASHGNHAQGVALAARNFGFKDVLLVLPLAPQTQLNKIRACLAAGALVMLSGDNLHFAMEKAKQIEKDGLASVMAMRRPVFLPSTASDDDLKAAVHRGRPVMMYDASSVDAKITGFAKAGLFVPTYDDPRIAMGQGVDAMELLGYMPRLLVSAWTYLFPAGGLGKGAGDGSVLKHHNSRVRLMGVSSDLVPAAWRSLKKGFLDLREEELHQTEDVPKYADGTDVPEIGAQTFAQYMKLGGSVGLVTEDEIAEALVFADTHPWYEDSVKRIEGSAASSIAALMGGVALLNKPVVLSVTGKNIDPDTMSRAYEEKGWVASDLNLYREVSRVRRDIRHLHPDDIGAVKSFNHKIRMMRPHSYAGIRAALFR